MPPSLQDPDRGAWGNCHVRKQQLLPRTPSFKSPDRQLSLWSPSQAFRQITFQFDLDMYQELKREYDAQVFYSYAQGLDQKNGRTELLLASWPNPSKNGTKSSKRTFNSQIWKSKPSYVPNTNLRSSLSPSRKTHSTGSWGGTNHSFSTRQESSGN